MVIKLSSGIECVHSKGVVSVNISNTSLYGVITDRLKVYSRVTDKDIISWERERLLRSEK